MYFPFNYDHVSNPCWQKASMCHLVPVCVRQDMCCSFFLKCFLWNYFLPPELWIFVAPPESQKLLLWLLLSLPSTDLFMFMYALCCLGLANKIDSKLSWYCWQIWKKKKYLQRFQHLKFLCSTEMLMDCIHGLFEMLLLHLGSRWCRAHLFGWKSQSRLGWWTVCLSHRTQFSWLQIRTGEKINK